MIGTEYQDGGSDYSRNCCSIVKGEFKVLHGGHRVRASKIVGHQHQVVAEDSRDALTLFDVDNK
jgi:hypothetical protein